MYITHMSCRNSFSLHAKPSSVLHFARRSRTAFAARRPAPCRLIKTSHSQFSGICRVLGQQGSIHAADATATSTTAGVRESFNGDGAVLGPCVGPVVAAVAPGAGLGIFTTQPVVPGQLLLISQPLATVALRPTAVASGPSKLIQTLLSELHNTGQRKWLQTLCDRHAIAHDQLQLEGSTTGISHQGVQGSGTHENLGPVIDLVELQGLSAAGGQLDRLQMTPMQLADMVQECAYTLDPEESSTTAQLLGAAGAVDSSSGSSSMSGDKACCGLWPEIALMARSCAPNVVPTLLGEGLLLLRAADYMPAGAQLFISELQPHRQLLQPLHMRQQILNQGSGLHCSCSRCRAEEELTAQHPQLQQLLHNLQTTAAAAAATMARTAAAASGDLEFGSDGDEWGRQNSAPQGSRARSPLQWGRQVLEARGGLADANGEEDQYQGDDYMWEGVEGGAQPERGVNASNSSSSSHNNNSNSNGVRSSSPVIAAEYVPVDCDHGTAAAAAVAGSVYNSGGSGQQQQQQLLQREVALEWLERLVADLLQLLSISAPSPAASSEEMADQNLLLSAACYSSWAAVRQALVTLSSSSSSSNSVDKLLVTQLQYLLTRADLSPITNCDDHDASGLSWRQLLLRTYDLEITTLATVIPGSLDHVLVSTAAAAVATEAIQEANIGQDQYDPGAAAVAGGFTNALNHAVSARFGGSLDYTVHQELLQACRAVAADAGVMPPSAVAAAAGMAVQSGVGSNSSNANGSSSYRQQQQQQEPFADLEIENTVMSAAAVIIEPTDNSTTPAAATAAEGREQATVDTADGIVSDAASVVMNFMKEFTQPKPTETAAAAATTADVGTGAADGAAAAAAVDNEAKLEEVSTTSSSSSSSDDATGQAATATQEAAGGAAAAAALEVVEVEVEVEVGSSSSSNSAESGATSSSSSDVVTGQASDWWAATTAEDGETTAAAPGQQVYTTDDGTEVIIELGTSQWEEDGGRSVNKQQQQQQQQDVYSSSSSSSSREETAPAPAEDIVSGGEDDWWSAAAAAQPRRSRWFPGAAAAADEQDTAAAAPQPRRSGWFPGATAEPSARDNTPPAAAAQPRRSGWLSTAARADAQAASRSSSPSYTSSSSSSSGDRSSSRAVNISTNGDDFMDDPLETTNSPLETMNSPPATAAADAADQHNNTGQQHDVDPSDVSSLIQPWQRGPPASWIRSADNIDPVGSDLSGDDFDLISQPPLSSSAWPRQQHAAAAADADHSARCGAAQGPTGSSSSSSSDMCSSNFSSGRGSSMIEVDNAVLQDAVHSSVEQAVTATAAAEVVPAPSVAAAAALPGPADVAAEVAAKPRKSRWAALVDSPEENSDGAAVEMAASQAKSKWAALAADTAELAADAAAPHQNSNCAAGAQSTDVAAEVAAEVAATSASTSGLGDADVAAPPASPRLNADSAGVVDEAALAAARMRYAAMADSAHVAATTTNLYDTAAVVLADMEAAAAAEALAMTAELAGMAHFVDLATEVAVEAEEVAAAAAALAAERESIHVAATLDRAEERAYAADQLAVTTDQEAKASTNTAAAAAAALPTSEATTLPTAVFNASDFANSALAESSSTASTAAAEAAAAAGGAVSLPAAGAAKLQRVLAWTVEVSGPLTPSQEALVHVLLHGSSNSSKGAPVDAEQVQLLRQLLGLI